MRFRGISQRAAVAAAATLLVFLALPARPAAHDIPADTTIRMFIKPDGQRLRMLVRVQMMSINDIDWPLHKETGYLDIARVEPFLKDASTMWIGDYIEVYEGGRKLAYPDVASVRLVPDGDLSFEDTYDVAVAHMNGPRITEDTQLFPTQGLLDVMFDYKIESPTSNFSINPKFDRLGLRVTTILQFLRANGTIRSFEYVGLPGLVRLDPQWTEAAWRFVQMGFFHLLDETGPLLFLLCLVMPFRGARGLVPVVAAFVAAHSITLIASMAYGMMPGSLWFTPLIGTLGALSVFYIGMENIVGARLDRRWLVAFGFGLVDGFAFALALRPMLQFAGSHTTVSLIAFNVGIEVAIAFVLVLIVFGFELLFRYVVAERMGTIVASAIVAHAAWHWMADRYGELRRYPLRWPSFDLLFLASLMRWMMVGVVLAAAVWAIGLLRHNQQRDPSRDVRI